jgi:predicted RNA-binding Zn ribbon-like protein
MAAVKEPSKPELQLLCDFVNTLDRESGDDELGDAQGLGRWLRGRGLWSARPDDRDAAAARELREALRELMRANNGEDVDTAAAAATLDAAARRARISVGFDTGSIRLVAPEGGVGEVLVAAGTAMADGSWPRLKACRSETCRWAFVDSARNRSRQWCSMSVCGNREKARTFRRRHGSRAA